MAQDPCCDTITGGRIAITVGEHVFSGRGDCEIEPRTEEREAGMTNDGKMFGIVRAKTAKMEIVFANLCERDPLELFDFKCKVNVTVEEIDRGFRHLFTEAMIIGTPRINLSTGEVSGIMVETDQYTRVTN
ncbi:MAG: phage tail tube protein [Anaerolineae bacterium]|nr:phage tail tube protein [Anaerolineae bacterium]